MDKSSQVSSGDLWSPLCLGSDLDLRQVQHGPLVGDDVKVHSLPHSVAHQAAHVPLPGDDDQVHACVGSNQQENP